VNIKAIAAILVTTRERIATVNREKIAIMEESSLLSEKFGFRS
jgi:hypothetical protein